MRWPISPESRKTSVFDTEKGKPTVRLSTLMAVLPSLNIGLTLDGPLMAECRASLDPGGTEPSELARCVGRRSTYQAN